MNTKIQQLQGRSGDRRVSAFLHNPILKLN